MKDLIIVGGGVAACTAGLFAGRRGLSVRIIAKDLGGQTASTSEIDNYPGVDRIEGPELIERFSASARDVGCEFVFDEVQGVSQDDAHFSVSARNAEHTSHALIFAFGKTPKSLGIEGEERFVGKGLHYCNSYEVAQYSGKNVAVVGGGNSALGLVWKLSGIAKRIYLIHRREDFRGEAILLDRLAGIPHCEKKVNTVVTQLHGTNHIEGVTIHNSISGEEENISVDAVFAAIGFESRTDFVRSFVECDNAGRIMIDQRCATSREGVFAAGDCTTVPYQQIIISAGDGAKAAISAYHHIFKKQGKRPLLVDWGFVS